MYLYFLYIFFIYNILHKNILHIISTFEITKNIYIAVYIIS